MPTNTYTATFDARRRLQRELAAPPAADPAAPHPALAAVPGLVAGAAGREHPVASAAGGSGGGSAAAAAAAASAGAPSREWWRNLAGKGPPALPCPRPDSRRQAPFHTLAVCPAAGPSASARNTRVQEWLRLANSNRIGPRLQALREEHRRNGLPL